MIDTPPVQRHYQHAPHAGVFMARALWRGKRRARQAPPLQLHWHSVQWTPAQCAQLQSLTGLPPGPALQLLMPHILGFRLVMATLTDAQFAQPIWSALQVRNRLRLLATYDPLQAMELRAHTSPWRHLAKGQEIDVLLELSQHGRCVWQGLTSFYYRCGAAAAASAYQPPPAPACDDTVLAQWTAPQGGGWTFGALTGDYNGLHWSTRYARAMGFAQAFHHPGRAVGQCLAQWMAQWGGDLPAVQALDVWIKGPVPYGTVLHLHGQGTPGSAPGAVLALRHGGDPRAALVLHWWSPPVPTPL